MLALGLSWLSIILVPGIHRDEMGGEGQTSQSIPISVGTEYFFLNQAKWAALNPALTVLQRAAEVTVTQLYFQSMNLLSVLSRVLEDNKYSILFYALQSAEDTGLKYIAIKR